MTSKSRLLLPPPPRFSPTPTSSSSSSFPPSANISATGSALDVIVVVPSSHPSAKSSFSRRNSPADDRSDDYYLPPSTTTTNNEQKKGIVASSDFFVTFPSGLAWAANNNNDYAKISTIAPPNSNSSLRKSITISKSPSTSSSSIRAYLYRRSKSFLSSGSVQKNSGTTIINNNNNNNNHEMEEDETTTTTDQGIEVCVGDGTTYHSLEVTTSEWGNTARNSRTELHHSSEIRQSLQQSPHLPTKLRRRGNVRVQINGRYIPQLDMIFAARRSNSALSSTSFALLGSGGGTSHPGDDEQPATTSSSSSSSSCCCRFVAGNELRPATEILDMLLTEEQEATTTRGDDCYLGETSLEERQSCTCHAAIKDSKFHLCSTTTTTTTTTRRDKTSVRQQCISNAYSRGAILTPGRNLIRYTLYSQTGTVLATAEAHLYVWNSMDSIIVSDIDGTITKSDVRGVIDTIIQDKFEHVHDDVCQLFRSILDFGIAGREEDWNDEEEEDCFVRDDSIIKQQSSLHPNSTNRNHGSQVRFLYLSARPISLISQTRKFLQSVSQTCPAEQKVHNLPPGPILCHRSALSLVLYSELVAKNIHEFKADVLARQVVLPFVVARGEENCEPFPHSGKVGDSDDARSSIADIVSIDYEPKRSSSGRSSLRRSSLSGISFASSHRENRLFLAGFGNTMSDAIAYEMAGMDRSDIYIIDTESRILCVGADERISVDERNDECIGDPDDFVAVRNFDCCADPVDCSFFVEAVCCPGRMDDQIFSEEAEDPIQSNRANAPPLVASKVTALHSTDLSPTDDCRHNESNDVTATIKIDCGDTSTSSDRVRRRSSVRAFTSKIPMKKFPSFKLASSMAKKSSSQRMFDGYGDPLLLERIRRRVAEAEHHSH